MNGGMQIGEIARKRAKILPDVLIEKGFFFQGWGYIFDFRALIWKANNAVLGADHLTLEGGWVILKKISCKRLLEEKNCMQHK